jgi:uncharacterized protein (TIGR01777 family)
MKTRQIVIAGGSGFLGRVLANHFLARGDRVTILSRHGRPNGGGAMRHVTWDGATLDRWVAELDGADALINLCGRSVDCRYHARNRRAILESRLRPTCVLGLALARCVRPPAVWINSSSATIYRHALDRPMDETTGEIGEGFSVDVCRQWEAALIAAPAPRTRKVALRSTIVFGSGGGAFPAFRGLARLGLGGTQGPGTQFVSWIHEDDFAQGVDWLLGCEDLDGPINLAAPNPLPNAKFMRDLRQACGTPIGLPAARWMLEIGAFFLRTETELLLKSRRVVATRLQDSGFQFQHEHWLGAVTALATAPGPAAGLPAA